MDESGNELRLRTNDILLIKNSKHRVTNAIIDTKGYVRARKGKLAIFIIKDNKISSVEHNEIRKSESLINSKTIKVYHGTRDINLVPKYGVGKIRNDYGRGFYTTPNKQLGMEWAYSGYSGGEGHYCYEYELDIAGLKILDFTKLSSLHWVAELLTYRAIDVEEDLGMKTVIIDFNNNFKLDTSMYDIIIGYRADDSYFKYIKAFVGNILGTASLEKSLRLGELGLQVFLKSNKAFNNLRYLQKFEVDVKYKAFYEKRNERALEGYRRELQNSIRDKNRITILSILDKIKEDNINGTGRG